MSQNRNRWAMKKNLKREYYFNRLLAGSYCDILALLWDIPTNNLQIKRPVDSLHLHLQKCLKTAESAKEWNNNNQFIPVFLLTWSNYILQEGLPENIKESRMRRAWNKDQEM